MKAEINGSGKCGAERDRARARAPLLRGSVLHVEEEHPRSWRPSRNFPALVTLLRVTRRVGRTTKIPLGRPLRLGNMTGGALPSLERPLRTPLLFRARYSYLHAIRQDVQSGSRYTFLRKVSKHEIEPSRRLNVRAHAALPKGPQIFIKYTRFRFSDPERCGIFDVRWIKPERNATSKV